MAVAATETKICGGGSEICARVPLYAGTVLQHG